MATVEVTLTLAVTCHYWFMPQAHFDLTTGAGITMPDPIHGFLTDGQGLDVQMDPAFRWDLSLRFRNADPIYFEGFQPGVGGDLLELLTAQGWVQ